MLTQVIMKRMIKEFIVAASNFYTSYKVFLRNEVHFAGFVDIFLLIYLLYF